MTDQAFNKWCAEKAGHQNACPAIYDDESDQVLYDYQECACDYATDLAAMLRVCEKQGWPYSLAYDKFSGHNTHKAMVGLTGCRWHPMARWHYAGTAEAALKAALVEVMESEKN